jgi:RHS repeat-associated protein
MLKSVEKPNGSLVEFEYDALGRRTAKIHNNLVKRYLWDGNVLLHEWQYNLEDKPQLQVNDFGELSFDTQEPIENLVTWVYEEGSFVPSAKIVNNSKYSIISDYISRPVQAYSEKGDLVWETDYDIYGGLRNLKGEKQFIPFRQLGQYEDVETGLYYNRFRYYSPETGTYLSQDMIGLKGGMALYAYVHDPNSFVDIFGLMAGFPTNVDFTGSADLFPTTGSQKNIVDIVMTGDRDADFTRAYKEAGISKSQMKGQGYTWHHVHDFDPTTGKTTMQLVKTSAHEATLPHKGSASQFASHFKVDYDTYEAKMKAYEQGWRKKPKKCK